MKLQIKMVSTILAIFIISISFMGVLIFSNSKINLETQIENQLLSTSQITEENINTFLDGQTEKIELIATQSGLSNEELIEMISLDYSFYDLFVINSSGIVTASSNPERIGLDRANRTYFINARNKTYISSVYFALVPQEYSISVSTPFHEGVLVGSIKISYLNKFISNRQGLGETGETLLAFKENNNIIYFTKRLFSDKIIEIIPEENSNNLPIYSALNKEEKLFLDVNDYRNEKVLAVTNYLEMINVGMVTKIDIKEALSGIDNLQKTTIFLVLLIVIIIVFMIYIITKPITKEIKDISKNIDTITRGNLDIQLKKSNIFEIQNLVNSLNRILASMKLAILRTGLTKGEFGIGEAIQAKEEAEEKYKILYDTSSRAIMTIEPPEWKFTGGNPATFKIFGVKDEKELTSLGPWDVSPEKQPNGELSSKKAKEMIMKAMKDGESSFEWTHKKLNGKEFLADVLLSKVKEGNKEYLQAVIREMGNQKKSEIKSKNRK